MRKIAAVWTGLVLATLAVLTAGTSASASPGPDPTGAASPPTTQTPQSSPTEAAEPEQGLRVFVRQDREGVGGVEVTVSRDGQEVATGTTDESGTVVIAVPEAGEYTATLDTDTLPEGLQVAADSVTREVRQGEVLPAAFRIGNPQAPAADSGGSETNRTLQLIVQGLRFGLIIALASIGLSMIFGTTGLTNFAHGELVTFGALAAFWVHVTLGVPLLVAAPVAVLLAGLFGYANDRLLWGPLRSRGTGLIAMMIVSIGLAIALRYAFLFQFGGSTRNYVDYTGQAGIQLGPVSLRPADMVSMVLAVVVLVAVALGLQRTRIGKATRAVADNPALAAATGIDVDRVIRVVWVTGAALAGLSGVLLGMAQGVSFQMGQQILLLVFAAVILGGLGTAYGALAGSLVVGVFIEVSTLVVPTELKNVGALAVLIIILLVRPQGILGRRERIG